MKKRGAGERWLILSVRLCLSSVLGVLHHMFHGKCTGADYHGLEREREGKSEKGFVQAWDCVQKMSSRVSILRNPCLGTHLQLLQDITLYFLFTIVLSGLLHNHFSASAAYIKKTKPLFLYKHP